MKKLLIIGIDGLDRQYVESHLEYLPTFKKIVENSPKILSTSVFPPDSDTAWTTIYTGLNPAKHGVVDFVDPLERQKIGKKEYEYSYINAFKGKTFWDLLSKSGKRVCIIFPHMVNPTWDINGFMISPDPKTGKFTYSPAGYNFNFTVGDLKVLKRLPRTKFEFEKYLNTKREIVINEFNFAIKMLKNENWDLFFFYTSALDSMMHLFWNYCDQDDPTYPGPNRFQNSILDFHILHDKLINQLLQFADSNTTTFILSDHGHFRRPVKLFNINEFLRREGLLTIKSENNVSLLSAKQKFKRLVVDLAQKSGMRPAAQTILRLFPRIKEMYTKPSIIDFEKTLAHCTDLSGMKAYNYGGIKVYREKFNNENDFIITKQKIISVLKKVKIPNTEEPVFEWIRLREEVYNGQYLDKYPDIIFNLNEEYGAGWDVKNDLWDKALAHKFFPGSHRGSTPVFYLINFKGEINSTDYKLEGIFPTIMKYFNININENEIDGESFIK